MALSCPADDISLAALHKDVRQYSWGTFRQDALSGLSVALLTLPQAMAYALLAGLPLACGLFAAIYASIISAFFGSSRHLVVGPSNAIALLIQASTSEILFTYYRDLPAMQHDLVALQILTQITLVAGSLQVLAAWCRLGRLTQFVSHSVIIGYVTGASIAVVISQLFVFLGIPRMLGVHSLYEQTVYLITHAHLLEWPTTLVGVGSVILLLILKKINKRIPAAVITFAVAGIIVEIIGLSSYSASSLIPHFYEIEDWIPNVMVIGDTGEVYDVIPQIGWPFFNMRLMNEVLPVAFAIALLSIMETTSVAKSIAASSGQRLAINQEIFSIGLGNISSSFIGAMPVSGSPSRSSLNYNNGGQTRFSAILNALFVALIVFILGFLVTRIPLAALAALLLVTATKIVNKKQMVMCLKSTRADAFVLWTTLLSCIFFSLDIAFYIGVALSITLYLTKAAIPQLVEYQIEENGELKNLDSTSQHIRRTIRVIKVEGELFFGAADLFQTTLKTLAEDDTNTRVIILQLKNARDIDATVCLALHQLNEYLTSSGRYLVCCGMTPPIWEVLYNSGLVEEIGKENLFTFDERHPHQHMQQALQRAKKLSVDTINPPPAVSELPTVDPIPLNAST